MRAGRKKNANRLPAEPRITAGYHRDLAREIDASNNILYGRKSGEAGTERHLRREHGCVSLKVLKLIIEILT
jgi:hypothetical protein